jgi:H+/gluconate symporter-like permease
MYIIGFITGIVLASLISYIYILLTKQKKTVTIEPDAQEKEKQRQLQTHFEGLINYDVKQAYGGKNK